MACLLYWLAAATFHWEFTVLMPDPRDRVTIYGVGYNLAGVIFGGTANVFGSFLVTEFGMILLCCCAFVFVCFCVCVCVCFVCLFLHKQMSYIL